MKHLLALFVVAAPLSAAVTATNWIAISDGKAIVCVTKASGDDVRASYDEDPGTTFTNYQEPSTSNETTACVPVSNGFDPEDVINVEIQADTGSGFAAVDCNSLTNDLTPAEALSTGSVTCNASGYFQVTFGADNGMTPTAPSGYPDGTLPDTSSGTEYTASSCDAIQTAFDSWRVASGDGNDDRIEIDWDVDDGCASELNFVTGVSNTDELVITSSRWDTDYCPPDGVQLNPTNAIGCAPRIWREGAGNSNGSLVGMNNVTRNIHFRFIQFTTPDKDSTAWGEGGPVDSWGDSGGDLDLNFASANNFDTSPNHVIVTHCTDSSLNGVYYSSEWTDTDADTATLVGEAGKSAAGCYVFQDPTGASSLSGAIFNVAFSSDFGFNQVVVSQRYPDRRIGIFYSTQSDDYYFVNSTLVMQSRFPVNSGTTAPAYGNQFGASSAVTSGFRWDGGRRIRATNNLILGAGLWVYGNDDFQTEAQDHYIARHFYVYPDELYDAGGSTADFDRVVVPCRGHFYETKAAVEVELDGILMSGLPSCAGSDNTPSDIAQIRNVPSATSISGTKGTRDVLVKNIVIHNSPGGILFEGQRWDQGDSGGSAEGRFRAYNILGNRMSERNETAEDVSVTRGWLANITGNVTNVSVQRFTQYKAGTAGGNSTIAGNHLQASKLQIEDGVLAPENRSQGGGAFFRMESSTGAVPSTTNSEEGAEGFYNASQQISATNSYYRDISLVCGRESNGTDFTVTSDGARMTASECSDQYTSTNYTFATLTDYTSAAGTSIQSDIDDMGLSDDLEYTATAGRGIDPDELRIGIGLMWKYTGETEVINVARNGNTGWTAKFRAPTSSVACYGSYYEYGTTDAPTEDTITAGSRDRTWSVTGLTAETRYAVQIACAGYPDVVYAVWQPGS